MARYGVPFIIAPVILDSDTVVHSWFKLVTESFRKILYNEQASSRSACTICKQSKWIKIRKRCKLK